MRVIEARQTQEEIVLMSWSPKMDLLALANIKGDLTIHRLSWAKVWQIKISNTNKKLPDVNSPEDEAGPEVVEYIAWHPEGIFLGIVTCSRNSVIILDVETGQVVHSHSLLEAKSTISALSWSQSAYEISTSEIVSSMTLRNGSIRNGKADLKCQRLESHLSLLMVGTSNGLVFVYTGGFLFAMCLKIPAPISTTSQLPTPSHKQPTTEILDILLSEDLDSFQFLIDMNYSPKTSQPNQSYLSLCHFKNEIFPRVAPLIGPLGFRYIFFIKNLSNLHSEFTSINDQWSKVVDIYSHYLSFGSKKGVNCESERFEEIRADYIELLITGICSPDMEVFLGASGKEKEAKKYISTLTLACNVILEHLRSVHSTLIFLLTDLNEIGGFLHRISRYEQESNRRIIQDLKKSITLLYLGTLELKKLVSSFGELSIHFLHLILNTIRLVNQSNIEAPDIIEDEAADTEKVLEYLENTVLCDIFDFLFANVKIGYPSAGEDESSYGENGASAKFYEGLVKNWGPDEFIVPNTPKGSRKSGKKEVRKKGGGKEKEEELHVSFKGFISHLIRNGLNKNESNSTEILDFTEQSAKEVIFGLRSLPTLLGMADKLLQIPVLCSIPFEADNYPLIPIPFVPTPDPIEPPTPTCTTRLKGKSKSQISKGKKTAKASREKTTGLVMNEMNGKSYAFLKWDPTCIYMFEFEFGNEAALVRSIRLSMSRPIAFAQFFSDSYLTLLSGSPESDEKSQPGDSEEVKEKKRVILAQLNFLQFIGKGTQVDLLRRSHLGVRRQQRRPQKPPPPPTLKITVPAEQPGKSPISPASANSNTNLPYIDQVLPVDGFVPAMMSIQGARKVGSLLGDSLRTILLLDLDTDFSDESVDEEDEDDIETEED